MIPRIQSFNYSAVPVDATFAATQGLAYILDEVRLVFNALPVTSELLELRVNQAGVSSLLAEWDPAIHFASNTTQGLNFDSGWQMSAGADLSLTYANTDANDIHLEFIVREYGGK